MKSCPSVERSFLPKKKKRKELAPDLSFSPRIFITHRSEFERFRIHLNHRIDICFMATMTRVASYHHVSRVEKHFSAKARGLKLASTNYDLTLAAENKGRISSTPCPN